MSDPASTSAFLAPRAATWICTVLLASFAGVVAFSVVEHPKAAAIEKFEQTTAAGDVNFYTLPTPLLSVPEPVLTWQGRSWAPASYEKAKINDPDMRRVGTDETTHLSIYEPREKKPDGYFIKIAVGEYLPIVAR